MSGPEADAPGGEGIRIDLWLFYARFFKTRSLSAKAVKNRRFRLNKQLVRKTSQLVRPGDVLTFPKSHDVMVVEVLQVGERRGPASEAQTLYRKLEDA